MKLASSLARNTITFAISSGSANLFNHILLDSSSIYSLGNVLLISVFTQLGATALTLIKGAYL